jgi:hypothetical protein
MLESAVREHPGDLVAQQALRDWLFEFEFTWIGAGRAVLQIVREELLKRQQFRVVNFLATHGHHRNHVVALIRRRAGVARDVTMNLDVRPGDQPATIILDTGYWQGIEDVEFLFKGPIEQVPADMRWIDGPVTVAVGAAWVERGCPVKPSVIIV